MAEYSTPVSLKQFLGELRNNQVRTQNMFELEISTGYQAIDDVFSVITMYGTGFTLPNRTQEFADVSFKGYPVPVPTVMKMEQSHTLTVNADAAGSLRRAFLAWQGTVADPAISQGSVFTGDRRVADNSWIRVKLLANDMINISEIYQLYGVKIESVGGLTVSNSDSGISTFDVGFRSIYWEIQHGPTEPMEGSFVNQY